MAFAVIGVIGPGLFQLKPPQWLGSDAPEQSVEVLSPPAEVGGEVALPEEPRQRFRRLGPGASLPHRLSPRQNCVRRKRRQLHPPPAPRSARQRLFR